MIEFASLILVLLLTLIAGVHAAWWLVLAIAAAKPFAPPVGRPRPWTFAVLVPAHNEEESIGATLAAIRNDAYEPRPRILVVADNCTDRTAEEATQSGAEVLKRFDLINRGKGFALAAGIDYLAPNPPDALVVIDADTLIERGFFDAMAATLESGASVVQGHYRAAPGNSNLGHLRRVAFHLAHYVRPLGVARLGGGVGLKGNGMGFRWEAVQHAGVSGSGITEDAEHTLALAELGIAVTFAPGAKLTGAMAQNYRAAATQDRRWESGRGALRGRAIAAALRRAAARDVGTAIQALDIALLPLTAVVAAAVAAAAVDAAVLRSGLSLVAVVPIGAYLALGLRSARPTAKEVRALASAPLFLAYKAAILLESIVRKPAGWERTARETPVVQLAGGDSDQSAKPRAK